MSSGTDLDFTKILIYGRDYFRFILDLVNLNCKLPGKPGKVKVKVIIILFKTTNFYKPYI